MTTGCSKRVLVACEYSGTVRDAFAALGWDAWSCDLLPSEKPGNHHQCDVREVLHEKWDLLIGHPTCTYLSNSGVSWLHKSAERWLKLFDAADFFAELWNAPVRRIALENPVMHRYAKRLVGARQTQTVQPWMFGHMEAKATCLWLKNLPQLAETKNVKAETMKLPANVRQRLHYLPPERGSVERAQSHFPGHRGRDGFSVGRIGVMPHRFVNPFNRRDVAAYRQELDDAEARQCESCGEEPEECDLDSDNLCPACAERRAEEDNEEGEE